MIRKRVVLFCLLLCIAGGVAYSQESGSAKSATSSKAPTSSPAKNAGTAGQRVVIKVGNVQVTQAEFESRIEDIEPENDPDKGGDLEKDRRKLGDDYASVLMLSQQAVAEHLDASPEIARQLAIARLQILSDAQFAKLQEQAKPSMGEISQYYSTHRPGFDKVQVRRLFIWKVGGASKNTQGLSAEEAKKRADAILQAPPEEGAKLAEAFKDTNEGQYDGSPVLFGMGELAPKLEKAAFGSKVGSWLVVDDTPDSIILLQVVKRQPRSLEEVASLIERRLQTQKLQARMEYLKKQAGIWLDEQYFGSAENEALSSQSPSKFGKSTEKETGDQR